MTQLNTDPAPIDPHEAAGQGARVSPALLLFLFTGLLGLIAAGAILISESRDSGVRADDPARQPSRTLRDWQAQDFELMTLDGGTARLSDFSGRPVFLNFWRTDCPPCVRELPAFQAFMQAQGDDGAVVLAVNQGERGESIRAFLEQIGIDGVPVLLDENLDLPDLYPVTALPTTYLIDAAGMVRYLKFGEMTAAEMQDYLEMLEDAGPPVRG